MLSFRSRRAATTVSVARCSLAAACRNLATARYPVGTELAGYTIDRVQDVPEFNLTAVDLTSKRTGSKHLHIARADRNNVFGVVFKTNPPDCTGLPHMLEHTTLCGSEKYPVRDPFFKMLNRSLANFMNAMTGHDYTYFPFATTNSTDFNNLMDVYLDAVYKPLLKPEDFSQEGWRLEHEDPADANSPLTFKGVVYNEMKGQVSDPSYYFWIKFQQSIYPSLNNSGGDPMKITDSYYEDLVDFHSQHYHPSNSYTYTYGDLSLENALQKIDNATKIFGRRHRNYVVRQPVKLGESRTVEIPGPVDPMLPPEQQYKSSLTWYANTPTNIYESFLLKILATLLMDGHSAPLYQSLIESGLGTDFAVNTGMDAMSAVNFFTIGLNGLTKDASESLQGTVLSELQKAKEAGFPDQRIKAILHQLELSRKIESASFGLGLLSSLTPGLADNVDPLAQLEWSAIIDRFNKDYAEKGDAVFKDLIDKYLLDKPYFKYTMRPDESVPQALAEDEQQRLKKKEEFLTPKDKEVIYQKGQDLAKSQDAKEDLSCLPTLHISDIPREGRYSAIREKNKFQIHTSPKTNGITYFRGLKTLSADDLPRDLVKYLPLFTSCLTNLGTTTKSMSELEDDMKLYTGGLSASAFAHSSPSNPNESYLKFGIDSCCLDQNMDRTLALWDQLLTDTNFGNVAKLSTLVKSLVSDNLSGIVSSGHSFASAYAQSQLSPVAAIQESLGGIEQVQFLNELGKIDEQGKLADEIVPKLEQIADIVSKSSFKYALTCSKGVLKSQEKLVSSFDAKYSGEEFGSTYEAAKKSGSSKTYIQIPSQTNFAASALRGTHYDSPDGAALQVLAQLMTFKYLHKVIREKGGAYGGGASYDALCGLFTFYSYRDPNPIRSVETFQGAAKAVIDRIASGDVTLEDLDQAKLTIFQKIDAPEAVKDEGMALFNFDVDQDLRQDRREQILDTTLDDVTAVCDKYFGKNVEQVNAVIGSEPTSDGWNVVKL